MFRKFERAAWADRLVLHMIMLYNIFQDLRQFDMAVRARESLGSSYRGLLQARRRLCSSWGSWVKDDAWESVVSKLFCTINSHAYFKTKFKSHIPFIVEQQMNVLYTGFIVTGILRGLGSLREYLENFKKGW